MYLAGRRISLFMRLRLKTDDMTVPTFDFRFVWGRFLVWVMPGPRNFVSLVDSCCLGADGLGREVLFIMELFDGWLN